MSLPALATPQDLAERLGRDLTDSEAVRAVPILDEVSANARLIAGQDFTRSTSTERLRAVRGVIRPSQRPVVSVTSVLSVGSAQALPYYLDGSTLRLGSWLGGEFYPYCGPVTWADVEYVHGYDPVPPNVVGIVCQVSARTLGRQPTDSGITQESVQGYSYQVGSAGAQGSVGFLPAELEVLRRYAHPSGRPIDMAP